MKLFKIALTVLVLGYADIAFSQTEKPTGIVCFSTAIQPGPLCLITLNNKLFSIETSLVDSLIKPETIKSLKIEKEAKAAAIYGSRAANGVVIIEIKALMAKKEYERLQPFLTRF